jgi:hypothetical protein
MEKVIGKHYAKYAVCYGGPQRTVSVGVCKVLPAHTCWERNRLGKALVRISGPNTPEGVERINAMAERIALALDEGTYTGPKTVRV